MKYSRSGSPILVWNVRTNLLQNAGVSLAINRAQKRTRVMLHNATLGIRIVDGQVNEGLFLTERRPIMLEAVHWEGEYWERSAASILSREASVDAQLATVARQLQYGAVSLGDSKSFSTTNTKRPILLMDNLKMPEDNDVYFQKNCTALLDGPIRLTKLQLGTYVHHNVVATVMQKATLSHCEGGLTLNFITFLTERCSVNCEACIDFWLKQSCESLNNYIRMYLKNA